MNLLQYYKKHIYEHGYFMAERDMKQGGNHKDISDDIYFNDEMDWNICADYYGQYVGEEKCWTQDDIDFLAVLGFGTGDFENE